MKAYHLLALALFAWLLAGCQLELPPAPLGKTTALDTPFTLMLGESIAVDGEPATIRLERWIEDHRCPAGQECAESGPVKVQITLWREGKPMTYPVFTVHTDQTGAVLADAPGSAGENKVGPYRITLTAVTPYPDADGIVAPDEYRATLILSKDQNARPDTDADMSVITDNPFTLAPGELLVSVRPPAKTPKTVTIAAGQDSLAAIRDAINAADAGVSASIEGAVDARPLSALTVTVSVTPVTRMSMTTRRV